MTDVNRIEAQAELRQVIADAFAAHTLWTTDWAGVQLQRSRKFGACPVIISTKFRYSLLPKPVPSFNHLKRKTYVLSGLPRWLCIDMRSPCSFDNAPTTKKAKKAALKNNSTGPQTTDFNDQAALNRRAQRFQREHELERSKGSINSNGPLRANSQNAHLFNNGHSMALRSASPFGNLEEPGADPVCLFADFRA